ncbi:hypothetical protein D3C87_1293700 [compost metagenome]
MVGAFGKLAHLADGFLVVRQFQGGLDQRLLVQEVGAEEPGFDNRRMDAQRRQLLVQRFGNALHRKLGGTVDAPAHVGLITANRRDVDDVTATLATHVRQYRAGDVEHAEHVGGKQALGFAGAGLFHRAQHAETGIVDQHVNPAKTLDAFRDRLMRFFFAGHVQTHGQQVGMVAQFGDDFFRFTGGGNHRVAGTQSTFCDEGTKTTGSSSNQPSTHFNSSCQRPERYCRAFLMS